MQKLQCHYNLDNTSKARNKNKKKFILPCLYISSSLTINLNPIPIGLFRGLESIGGGADLAPPPQISATNGPIDSKIGTVVKQVK